MATGYSEESDGGCCRCCCSFIFTSGLTALFLWLSLQANSPICSIEHFNAFALNKTANSTAGNHTLYYDLKLNNKNKDMGIYYDALNLTFYYKPNLTTRFIGNQSYRAFYQGHKKYTHRKGSFDATTGVKWENATAATALFRVELATAVRYKIIFWKAKRHRLLVGADLQVNDQGSLVRSKKKGIKLTSAAVQFQASFGLVGILGILSFVHLL